jgi:hypothetical protein
VRIGVSFKTKTKVAIKEIPTQDLQSEQLQDLEKEMSILSQFNHANIVRIYEIYKEQHATYIVRPLISPFSILVLILISFRFASIYLVVNYLMQFVNKNFIKKMMHEES